MSGYEIQQRILQAAQLAQPIYSAHGWTWGREEDKHVPTVADIERTLTRLYNNALASKVGSSSSGRLSVWIDEEDGEVGVEVQLATLVEAS